MVFYAYTLRYSEKTLKYLLTRSKNMLEFYSRKR